MQTSTTTTTAMPASDRMSSAAIVLGVCVGGAVLLRYFLLAESWVTVLVRLTVDDDLKTDCTARLALPTTDDDNPWRRRGDQWTP